MIANSTMLSDLGYYQIAPGKLATIVTSLEMWAKPDLAIPAPRLDVQLSHWPAVSASAYRDLYRLVGEDWLWCSRLLLDDGALNAIVNHPKVDVYAVMHDGIDGGLLELDYRESGNCEIAFFGVGHDLIGGGVGGWLMGQALELAWSRQIERMWVHTCTLDHPSALGFYQRFGFVPFKQQVEILDDPRLDGTLPVSAAAHVPLIRTHQ